MPEYGRIREPPAPLGAALGAPFRLSNFDVLPVDACKRPGQSSGRTPLSGSNSRLADFVLKLDSHAFVTHTFGPLLGQRVEFASGLRVAPDSKALLVAYGVTDCYSRIASLNLSVLSELRVDFKLEEVSTQPSSSPRVRDGAKQALRDTAATRIASTWLETSLVEGLSGISSASGRKKSKHTNSPGLTKRLS